MTDFYYKEAGKNNDIIAIVLSGELDASSCEYLLDCVTGQIEEGYTKLVLDCTDLTYISSIGMGMLIRVNSRMKSKGGDVKLAAVQGRVASILQTVKLDKVFHMYPTVDDAIAAHDA